MPLRFRFLNTDFCAPVIQAILEKVVTEVSARKEEFALALCMEAGKAIVDARGEVQRLIDTFKLAAGMLLCSL